MSTAVTMKAMFLLLAVSALSRVHCSADSSFLELLFSTTNDKSIRWKETGTKTMLDSRSHVASGENRGNETQSCKFEVTTTSGRFDAFKISFDRNADRSHLKCNFTSASFFDLTNNNLDNVILRALEELGHLAETLMQRNDLNWLSLTVSRISLSLKSLEIDANGSLVLPDDLFRDLTDLERIALKTNDLSTIPLQLIARNRKLSSARLTRDEGNLAELPSGLSFGGFADLRVVSLRGLGLHRLTGDSFSDSRELREIDLSENRLETLPKDLLKDARELRTLNVSSNRLTAVPVGIFAAAGRLQQLDLSKNYIAALDSPDLFIGLQSLQMLNMEENGLKFIHADAFVSLSNLKIAKFARNQLNLKTGVVRDRFGRASPFRHCRVLEELHLSNNSVSEMYRDWVVDHVLLRKLDLSHNNFSYLESRDLLFNSSNLYVDLSRNFITEVNLTQLDRTPKGSNDSREVMVNLNFNPIDCYCEVHSLELYVKKSEYTPLKHFQLEADNLRCNAPPHLRGKRLGSMWDDSLSCSVANGRSKSCTSVEGCDCHIKPGADLWLNCPDRNLTVAPTWINSWGVFDAHLNFSGNALRRAPDLTRGGYETIRRMTLDLSRNEIDRVERHSVNEYFFQLLLSHNKITEIDMEIVRFLASTRIFMFRIRANPWPCNRRTLGFRDYVRYAIETGTLEFPYWDMKDFTCGNADKFSDLFAGK